MRIAICIAWVVLSGLISYRLGYRDGYKAGAGTCTPGAMYLDTNDWKVYECSFARTWAVKP